MRGKRRDEQEAPAGFDQHSLSNFSGAHRPRPAAPTVHELGRRGRKPGVPARGGVFRAGRTCLFARLPTMRTPSGAALAGRRVVLPDVGERQLGVPLRLVDRGNDKSASRLARWVDQREPGRIGASSWLIDGYSSGLANSSEAPRTFMTS
jgi:hypothetical protein